MQTRFKQFRTYLGLSQAKLAVRLGCTQQKIFCIERGTQPPSIDDLLILADLGLDIHWLICGVGSMLHNRTVIKQQVKSVISILEAIIR